MADVRILMVGSGVNVTPVSIQTKIWPNVLVSNFRYSLPVFNFHCLDVRKHVCYTTIKSGMSHTVCAFKLSSPRPPSPLASINVAVLVMVLAEATADVLNTMPSIANTVQIQIPTNLGNSAQLVKDTINMATLLMTALSFQMLVRWVWLHSAVILDESLQYFFRMVNVKTICQDSLAFAMKVTPLMKLEQSALVSLLNSRVEIIKLINS